MFFIKLFLTTLLGLFAATSLAQEAEPPPALRALISKYRCPIYDRLVRIHDAGNPMVDYNRFIALSLPDGHYVQCKFHDLTLRLYCEAASGFYEAAPGRRRTTYLSPASLKALARLGFSTDDTHGNYTVDFDVGPTPDYAFLADVLLTTLLVAYDARADMTLTIDAPFAPLPTSTCDPTS